MAERPPVITLRFKRAELYKLIQDPRLLRAFEAIALDVSETLPDAIAGATEDADTMIANEVFRRRAEPAPTPGGVADLEQILAGDMFRRQAEPAARPGGVSDSEQIMAAGAFIHRAPQATFVGREADAATILATQIFGS